MPEHMQKAMKKADKAGALYAVLRGFLRIYHDKVFYRHVYYIGRENIPASAPAIIASNHQNNVNDALGIVFACNKHKFHLLTRADIFGRSELSDKFFKGIGLIPAYRLNFDGEESLIKNTKSFEEAGELLDNGGKIVIFPEACHQDRHWLGTFSSAYLKIAFEAAEKSGFQKDIHVVPACNHYSDYFGMRNDLVIKFGTPISLKPYYDLYAEKPRTAQREVNRLVRDRVKEMMLDIRDSDNYEAIMFMLDSYGCEWAVRHGFSPEKLPEKLEADRLLSDAIGQASEESPERMAEIIRRFAEMKDAMSASGLEDRSFRENPGIFGTFLRGLALILLSPLAVAGLWPSLPMYAIPKIMMKGVKDKMFEGSLNFGLNTMVILPLLSLLSFIIAGLTVNWWAAAIWTALFPGIYAFEWDYCRGIRKTIKDIRYCKNRNTEPVRDMEVRRKELFNDLEHILSRRKTA